MSEKLISNKDIRSTTQLKIMRKKSKEKNSQKELKSLKTHKILSKKPNLSSTNNRQVKTPKKNILKREMTTVPVKKRTTSSTKSRPDRKSPERLVKEMKNTVKNQKCYKKQFKDITKKTKITLSLGHENKPKKTYKLMRIKTDETTPDRKIKKISELNEKNNTGKLILRTKDFFPKKKLKKLIKKPKNKESKTPHLLTRRDSNYSQFDTKSKKSTNRKKLKINLNQPYTKQKESPENSFLADSNCDSLRESFEEYEPIFLQIHKNQQKKVDYSDREKDLLDFNSFAASNQLVSMRNQDDNSKANTVSVVQNFSQSKNRDNEVLVIKKDSLKKRIRLLKTSKKRYSDVVLQAVVKIQSWFRGCLIRKNLVFIVDCEEKGKNDSIKRRSPEDVQKKKRLKREFDDGLTVFTKLNSCESLPSFKIIEKNNFPTVNSSKKPKNSRNTESECIKTIVPLKFDQKQPKKTPKLNTNDLKELKILSPNDSNTNNLYMFQNIMNKRYQKINKIFEENINAVKEALAESLVYDTSMLNNSEILAKETLACKELNEGENFLISPEENGFVAEIFKENVEKNEKIQKDAEKN